jgi:hypothetical protein
MNHIHIKRTLVLLEAEPEIFLLEEQPPSSFIIGDKHFLDMDYGDSPGFYDWLRTKKAHIIGVRFTPSDDFDSLVKYTQHLSYCESVSEQLEIYFTNERKFDSKISDDCYFGGNNIYLANGKALAILFDVDRRKGTLTGLGIEDINSLISIGAKHVNVKDLPA